MNNRRKRLLCLMLVFLMLFSCVEKIRDNHLCKINDENVINRYSSLVSLYDPITTNSEICTTEMVGNRNLSRFVQGQRKSTCSKYVKEVVSEFFLQQIYMYDNERYIINNLEYIYTCCSKAVIVDYMHRKDGGK